MLKSLHFFYHESLIVFIFTDVIIPKRANFVAKWKDYYSKYDSIEDTHLDRNNADILYDGPVKGILAKGPELKMQIIPGSDTTNNSRIRVDIIRGKKQMFTESMGYGKVQEIR